MAERVHPIKPDFPQHPYRINTRNAAQRWLSPATLNKRRPRGGNEACNPTNLAEAKRQALAMAVGGIGDYQVSDPIKELHDLRAIIERRSMEEAA